MSETVALHKTVIGYSHTSRGIVCEDYSGSKENDGAAFAIAVADGHGDDTCVRSADGSAFAVNIALERLMDFAIPQDGNYELLLRKLAGETVKQWRESVLKDISEKNFTEAELQSAGKYGVQYQNGLRQTHAYGSTLIAALWTEEHLLLMQQGDGRCCVLFEDGNIEQPIPWDNSCVGNVTTSLCDAEADTAIRCAVLDMRQRRIAACWLCSDGVEDAFTGIEGTFSLLGELTCRLAEEGREAVLKYLDDFLPGFSKRGSGDDVSVAVIADLSLCRSLAESLHARSESYTLRETLQRCEEKLVSMSRKHKYLEEKCEEDREKLIAELKTVAGVSKNPGEENENDDAMLDKLAEQYECVSAEYDEYHRRFSDHQENCKNIRSQMKYLEEVICGSGGTGEHGVTGEKTNAD